MSLPRYPTYIDSGVAWLGEVPAASWKVAPFKRIAKLTYGDALPTEIRSEHGSTDVYGSNGPVGVHNRANTSAPVVVIGRKGSFGALNWSDSPVFAIDTAYFLDRMCSSCDLRWIFWALHNANLDAFSQDTGVPGLARELVHSMPFAIPDLPTQCAIASFLDRETSKIDTLVAEQERLIGLLKEKRQAVISQAVTKGLDPNVPMKDSGVEWLGVVPGHWVARKLKHLIQPGSSISYGIVQPGEPQDEGVPFVQTTNMTAGAFNLESLQKTTSEIAAVYPRSRLKGGEVILGIRASIGACHVVPLHLAGANLSRGVARVECDRILASEFLVTFLRSGSASEYWTLMRQGSTFNEVSIETVRDMHIPLPPLEEQNRIVAYVSSQVAGLEALLKEASQAVALLKERRSALISAAVTGKIDVRGLVPAIKEAA